MVAKKYVLSVAVMVKSVCQTVLAALRVLGGYKIRRHEPIFYKLFDKIITGKNALLLRVSPFLTQHAKLYQNFANFPIKNSPFLIKS